MLELVTVRDGSRTVYVEKNLIKQVVIHPVSYTHLDVYKRQVYKVGYRLKVVQ